MAAAKNVDDYIARASESTRPILVKLREIVRRASPRLEEAIKWGVPFYLCNGPVIGFAAYKNHISWGLWKAPLLLDPDGLIGNGILKGGKMSTLSEIPPAAKMIALIRRAIALNEAGDHSTSNTMAQKNPKVDAYLGKLKQWSDETAKLRSILLSCGLTEELKWGKPCYAFEGSNVIVLQGFKAYCAMLFMKGMLLEDPDGILVKTGENTRVGRQIRFSKVAEITKLAPTLKAYVQRAIEIEKSGLKIEPLTKAALELPAEFQRKLDKLPAVKTAFESLTPGRQRAYSLYFMGAKQAKTRESRIEKCLPAILEGKGLNE